MQEIHIGLLLPSSTILPVSKDFEKGLKQAFGNNRGLQVTITKEFIGQGAVKQVEDACNKLFNYDDVDIIAGVLSNRAGEELAEKFKSRKKPLVINNAGGHVPCVSKLNEYIFINSINLWQHAWAMGNWGVQNLGKKGMYVSGIYDAGYSFSQMFYEGMMAANTDSEWFFSVPPMPAAGQLSDMGIIFSYMEEYRPDFVFATFCGEETSIFLNEFTRRGWHEKTRLTGLPFLLAPFKPLTGDLELYITEAAVNDIYVDAVTSFYHLGYTTGIAIAEAMANDSADGICGQLMQGGKLFCVDANGKANEVYKDAALVNISACSIKAGNMQIDKKNIVTHQSFSLNDPELKEFTREVSAGWLNPYLCI